LRKEIGREDDVDEVRRMKKGTVVPLYFRSRIAPVSFKFGWVNQEPMILYKLPSRDCSSNMVTAVDHFSAVLEAKKSITLEGLQYEVNQISKYTVKKVLKQSDALHHVCTKKGVTIEIIEYLLSMSPDIRLDDTSTRFGDVQSWRNRNEIVSMTSLSI